LSREDGRIDWQSDAQTIHNHVRGMNPSPVAFTEWTRGPLKIHRTEVVDTDSPGTPGLVEEFSAHDGFIVSCGKGKLRVCEVQPPGKKRMDGPSFACGYRIEKGMYLNQQSVQ
ncbi:MAG: methionyl-tRNA formyltransferase, partial [Candidatus Latescibacteria bacterium]|nr:methionyl-tRNA formyltransferase [Candidatus Latescibacterota bacterium]